MEKGVCLLGLILTLCAGARALTIQGYDPARHDRFASGFATAPVPNTAAGFVGVQYDWSGVGWDAGLRTRNVAMISDRQFVYATHYAPGSQIQFLSPTRYAANPGDPAAAVVTYTWQTSVPLVFVHPVTGQRCDFSIGTLTSPLEPTDGIASYPILQLPSELAYVSQVLLTYGNSKITDGDTSVGSPRIGVDRVGALTDLDLYRPRAEGGWEVGKDGIVDSSAVYHLDPGLADNSQYVSGDSSGPLFVPWNGALALLGTHSARGTVGGVPAGYDNFIPDYLGQMSAFGVDYRVVPEPAGGSLLFGAAALVALARKR